MSTVRRVVNWFGRHDGAVAAVVFLLSLALYVLTMAPSVVAGDGGEMQTVAAVLGVAHPTGYPLFTLLGWLFTHLPLGGDPAYRVTLLSAVAAAGTVACLYLLIRELAVRRLAALLAAALVAVMPAIWLHAIVAGVYTLAHFFIILGLWTLLRWGHGKTPLWVPALVFGFGLAHHISLRLFGPAVLVYIIAVEPRLPLRPRRWLPALACLLLPFVVYAYIPLRAGVLRELAGLERGNRGRPQAGGCRLHQPALLRQRPARADRRRRLPGGLPPRPRCRRAPGLRCASIST